MGFIGLVLAVLGIGLAFIFYWLPPGEHPALQATAGVGALLCALGLAGLVGWWAGRRNDDAVAAQPWPEREEPPRYVGWAEVDQGGFMVYLEFPGHLHEVACTVRSPSGREYWAEPNRANKSFLTQPSLSDPRGAPTTAWFYPGWFLDDPQIENGPHEVTWYRDNASGPVIEQICVSVLEGVVGYVPGPCSSRAATSASDHT